MRKFKRLSLCIVTALILLALLFLFYPVDTEKPSILEVESHKFERRVPVDNVHVYAQGTSQVQDNVGFTIARYNILHEHVQDVQENVDSTTPQVQEVVDFTTTKHYNVDGNVHAYNQNTKGIQSLQTQQTTGLDRVLERVKTCLAVTHMADEANEPIALANAQEFYEQYTKVIPPVFLSNYSSHCWKMKFDINFNKNYPFSRDLGKIGEYPLRNILWGQQTLMETLSALMKIFQGNFSSDIICLPKVFLAGFPKCGSTYAFCFLQSLLHSVTGLRRGSQTEVLKEPHFWVRVRVSKSVRRPKPSDIGEYVLNFLPGLFKINSLNNKDVVLADGTPNMLFDSPRFSINHPNSSNYCLLPSALPELLPNSKFIVIMRNPLKMLYSAFWFSCITKGIKVPRKVQLLGPTLFHDRIKAKMDLFNDCMRDRDHPSIAEPCSLSDGSDYGSCIATRLHLLDKCVHKITFNLFSKELPECGRSRVEMGLYYTHVRKLLSVVPRERVLALTLEQLVKEPEVIARQILEFLEYPVTDDIIKQVQLITLTCTTNSQDWIPYKTDPELKMKDKTREMILKFFKPFNFLLSDLLQSSWFLWEGH